jgi:SAM-dependent methyltransferase
MDSEAWDERYGSQELVWSAEPNRFLVEEAMGMPPGRALDVACGEGRNAIWLATRGWEVTAFDFSKVAIEKAGRIAERSGVAVAWRVADAVVEELEVAAFDLVLVFYLHLEGEQRKRAFASSAGAVKTGGTLLVVGHDASNLAHGWGGPQDPSVLYSAQEVVADIEDGFEIEKAGPVDRHVETEDGTKTAIDVLVRARRQS